MVKKKISIMIVDDHAIMRESLAFLIENTGIGKISGMATNGKDFLEQLDECNPDIVLLDIIMPEMNGIEAAQKARIMKPDLKIIIVSMFNDFNVYSSLIQLGINGFIPKDSETYEIRKALETVMNNKSYYTNEFLQDIIKNRNLKVKLSEREKKVLQLICMGYSNDEIASKLLISIRTLEKNRSDLLRSTGCANSISLILYAIKNKLVEI